MKMLSKYYPLKYSQILETLKNYLQVFNSHYFLMIQYFFCYYLSMISFYFPIYELWLKIEWCFLIKTYSEIISFPFSFEKGEGNRLKIDQSFYSQLNNKFTYFMIALYCIKRFISFFCTYGGYFSNIRSTLFIPSLYFLSLLFYNLLFSIHSKYFIRFLHKFIINSDDIIIKICQSQATNINQMKLLNASLIVYLFSST